MSTTQHQLEPRMDPEGAGEKVDTIINFFDTVFNQVDQLNNLLAALISTVHRLESAEFFTLDCHDRFEHDCNIMRFVLGYMGLKITGSVCRPPESFDRCVVSLLQVWTEKDGRGPMRGGLAEDLGGAKRRAITEDVKDKKAREFQEIWETMDAKDKSIIRISVFGFKILERTEYRKGEESKCRAFELQRGIFCRSPMGRRVFSG